MNWWLGPPPDLAERHQAGLLAELKRAAGARVERFKSTRPFAARKLDVTQSFERSCIYLFRNKADERWQRTDQRRKQDVELALLSEQQLAVVTGHAFDRIAAVHRAAPLGESPPLFFRRFRRKHDALHAERGEESDPELVCGPDIENARDPDAQLRPGF